MVESHYQATKFDMVFTLIARPFAYNYFHIYHSGPAMTSARPCLRRLKIGLLEKNETRNRGLSSNSAEEEEEEEGEERGEEEEGRKREEGEKGGPRLYGHSLSTECQSVSSCSTRTRKASMTYGSWKKEK